MSQDLFSKKPERRNWARDTAPASQKKSSQPGVPVIAGSVPPAVKKIALGTMALGTMAGLAFITSPWWRPLPIEPGLRRDPARGRMSHPPGTASRITWSRR